MSDRTVKLEDNTVPLSIPIKEAVFSIIDVETTGLHSHLGNRITEIAVLKVQDGKPIDEFQTLVNPKRHIPQEISDITGITDEAVSVAPCFEEIADKLIDIFENTVLVFHNAGFDLGFIVTQMRNNGYPPINNHVVDTLKIARRCFEFPGNALTKIAAHLGFDYPHAHRAMADVLITNKLFDYLIENLKGAERLEDLIRSQGGPILIPSPDPIVLPPVLEAAFKNDRSINIKYLARLGLKVYRDLQPVEVNRHREHTYLIAYCSGLNEERTFRMDRIISMVLR